MPSTLLMESWYSRLWIIVVLTPTRLVIGDEIRCIAPSRNATPPWIHAIKENATNRLAREGFIPSFGSRIYEPGPYDSSSPNARIHDLHDAFSDPNVKAILSLIGGYNSNQLLNYINFDLITQNHKIICGYSDVTALTHAIYSQTRMITYSGAHFFNFGDIQSGDYTIHYFRECMMHSRPYKVEPCSKWSPNLLTDTNRTFIHNKGPVVIQEGEAEGISLGGNFRTFMLLSGTRFWPGLEGVILFLEDIKEVIPQVLDHLLESLISQTDFEGIKGLIFGRFHPDSTIDAKLLKDIISRKESLSHLPIVADFDFGHTHPIFTFPIGGRVRIQAINNTANLSILAH